MNRYYLLVLIVCPVTVLGAVSPATAQKRELIYAQDGSGVFGYKHTPIQPWSGFHVHDPDRPAPRKVTPADPPASAQAGTAPSDALVLFDGKGLDAWLPSAWKTEAGELIATDGPLRTKQQFGDCQLHLEWLVPEEPTPEIMNRGNNGLFFLGFMEVQIFDSYTTKIYPDGQAAAIYAQTPPLVNACRQPGQWQTYDIVFLAPKYQGNKLAEPARLTMHHNGIVVHHNQEIYGSTQHLELARYPEYPVEKGPIELSAHRCPVRFRNIWIRPL